MAKKKPNARGSQSAATRSATKVESLRHADKRKNIPTEELRDFVTEDEHAPKSMLYPRDPSLDPQLVWKGKDEQDQADQAVPIVPIYIQEKIHPQAIIDDVASFVGRASQPVTSKDGLGSPSYSQLNLFADFNGGPADFAQKVEFYQHEQNWANRLILGDSLLVMTSLAALALDRTRLMSAKYPYYVLADASVAVSLRETVPLAERADYTPDIKRGFVYKRVPHVTLKSIANNPDIREGMARQQIDAAIARHAETETLYDQPQEDNKRIRVCGPFTVESLSPHRTISAQEKKQRAEVGRGGLKMKVIGPDNFGHMVIENLRKAGVQNTRKNERLKGRTRRPVLGTQYPVRSTQYPVPRPTVRVPASPMPSNRPAAASPSVGPEHGTVGAMLIKEAAREAVKGVGFDVLVVCGFAFDPSVSEEAKRYGNLVVLPTKMNPDLAMGDELLKKTGVGNLFMVFGDPDVEIKKTKDGQFTVEINGLDVYDPTTGAIRSSSTDDIACWFIDTDYDEDSFFVRHAYFTGADEPYDKLKRALRAEIDEAAWSALYSTTSRPFPMPGKKGKIAVKVINHYGDEVLKVYDLKSLE